MTEEQIVKSEESEEIEIELDDETAAIANAMAEEQGISIDELISKMLKEAMETGYFNDVSNVTTDDPLV
jgi:predicted HicB family RNase H-like nuclease